MATREFIEKRIAGKQKEIEKLEKKLARIEKAQASGWENNPYYYSEYDLKSTLRDLDAAKTALEGYKANLKTEEEKANSRNIAAIIDFLNAWKQRVFKFYDKDLRAAHEAKKEVREAGSRLQGLRYGSPEYEEANATYKKLHKAYYAKLHGYYRDLTAEEKKLPKNRYKSQVKVREGEWEYITLYFEETYEESAAKLRRDLDNEADRKYDFIIERTNKIVGKITDASGLEIGSTGELNGYIDGERGTAKVQTIDAGGYNIQCYHFRTLVTPKK